MKLITKDSILEVYQVLKQNKLRTFLTALGVFWGIFILIILIGSGNALKNGAMEGFKSIESNTIFIWAQTTTKPYKGYKSGRNYHFTNEDVEYLKKNNNEIKYLSAQADFGNWGRASFKVLYGKKAAALQVLGVEPDHFKIDKKKLLFGRFLNEKDRKEARKYIVIGKLSALKFFDKPEDAIGKYLNINKILYKVVGVFGTFQSESNENEKEQLLTIKMPLTTLQKSFNKRNEFGWISICAKDNVDGKKFQDKVISQLKTSHSIAPDDNFAVGSFNLGEEFAKFSGLFTGIKFFIWIIAISSLTAGVIGISNIMLISIKERTKEIGLRKAIGAKNKDIISMLVQEAVILTVSTGYFAILIGTGLIITINKLMENRDTGFFKNPEIEFGTIVTCSIVLIISGFLAGYFPAKTAVTISPTQALMDE